ncbi:MAG: hypothetical protein U0O22_02320 [Acutalibacteraceae bacterium]
MKNPFLIIDKNGNSHISSNCSLNKMVIAKAPVAGIDDTINGKPVSDIFSIAVVRKKVKENIKALKIPQDTPDHKLASSLLKCMYSTDSAVCACAEEIARFFGKRFGLILLTLKTALQENRAVRPDWDNCHWEYWNKIENIIAVGGLTSGAFGSILTEEALKVSTINNKPAYKISVFENAPHIGVMGCAKLLNKPDGVNILMDLGQTNIKRSIVKREKGEITSIEHLDTLPSKFMEWNIEDEDERKRQAVLLHRYIIESTVQAYKQAERYNKVDNQFIISIASYTNNGELDSNRGGYAKLTHLYKNYEIYLQEELSSVLKTPVSVKLVHDGTAVALNFANTPNSVCITLGTFLGVGFTDIFNN